MFGLLHCLATKYRRVLVATAASVIVTLWTTLRFISNGANFDVVGQIGLAGQWAYGLHDGSALGATHYLLKMPFYALLNACTFIPPHARLYIAALVFNLVTFWILFWLGQRFLQLARIQNDTFWLLGYLWLAVISGRVLWMDYANSRNLEVVGGLIVVYLALILMQRASLKRFVIFVGLASIVFFADALQLYVVGGAIFVYGVGGSMWAVLRHHTTKAMPYAVLASAVVSSAGLAYAMKWAVAGLLPVELLRAPGQGLSTNQSLAETILGSLYATVRLFDLDMFAKTIGVVSLRHFIAWLLFGLVIWQVCRGWKRTQHTTGIWVVGLLIVTSYGLYALSGHALRPGTERYLVVVPFAIALLFGLRGGELTKSVRRLYGIIWAGCTILILGLLVGAVLLAWPQRFEADRPMFALAEYAKQSRADLIVSGRQYALPANYYAGYREKVAPVICTPQMKIKLSNLFFDQASWRPLNEPGKTIEIVVQPGGLYTESHVCNEANIRAQLGEPLSTRNIPFGRALIYTTSPELAKQLNE